jgi:two-component system, chemotaxis family, sensor kinase CheA
MSADREAMLERFRAGLLARVERIEKLLESAESGPAGDARKEALGELHTLKGEGRMLGLTQLADLAHALEDYLAHGGTSAGALRALDAMQKALSPALEPEISDAVLEAAMLELGHVPAGVASNRSETEELGEATADDTARGESRRYVQVDAATVDDLCERLSELGALYGRLRGRALALMAASPERARAQAALGEDFARVSAIVADTTTRAWKLRLVPVEPVLRELRRHGRVLADEIGKNVQIRVETRGVELERNVLDQLWDSLLHLVHNAIDHGLETPGERAGKSPAGTLTLSAEALGPLVVLRVEDDGRGVDVGALRDAWARSGRLSDARGSSDEDVLELLFEHGFSTRAAVDRTSGRGVGLAVVKRQVERLGGRVRIQSELGRGTRFELTVPFTITKERCLIVELGAALYAFPSRSVLAVLGSHELSAAGAGQSQLARYRGESLPLVSLARALGLATPGPDTAGVVLELSGRRYALTVPIVRGDPELIRRPAEALLGNLTGIAATALLDDGRLVLMLDVPFLVRALNDTGRRAAGPLAPLAGPRQRRVLVADDSPVVCQVVREILTSAGYVVEVTHDGTAALASFKEREPDLVLSDVEMPQMGGFELLGEIRRLSQKVPVVMLTTRGSLEDRQRATELGANAYLLKTGFKSDALLDVVRRFVPLRSGQLPAFAR